jgi:hypothetical protein
MDEFRVTDGFKKIQDAAQPEKESSSGAVAIKKEDVKLLVSIAIHHVSAGRSWRELILFLPIDDRDGDTQVCCREGFACGQRGCEGCIREADLWRKVERR